MTRMRSQILLRTERVVPPPSLLDFMKKSASQFVAEMDQSVRQYERRGTNSNLAAMNIFTGKLGELLAAYHLEKSLGLPVEKLDFGIRHGAAKGWEGDIVAAGQTFHVKTCDRSNWRDERGPSWGFQFANPKGRRGGRDPLFDRPDCDDPVILMYLMPDETGVFVGTAPWNLLLPRLEDPRLRHLVGVKKFAYLRTIAAPVENSGLSVAARA